MTLDEEDFTGLVRVVKTPEGESPAWVRNAWVNLELPAYRIAGILPGTEYRVLSKQKLISVKKRPCVIVPQKRALAILEDTHPLAATWWGDQGFPLGNYAFSFAIEEVELLRGVKMQTAIEVTDEMQGDPWR